MNSVVLDLHDMKARDAVMEYMLNHRIETRPFFVPMHKLPIYQRPDQPALPVAEELGRSGISLPSGASLSEADSVRVSECLLRALGSVS